MEECIQTLIELGLTKLQATVLFTLQKFDFATVKDISQSAGIHRQQIYPVLTELQKMGLVEKRIGMPNRYKASSLDQIFTVLLERKADWMSEMKKKTAELTEKLKATSIGAIEQKDYTFTLITGKERFKNALYDWGQSTQTIDFVLKFDRLSYHLAQEFEIHKIKYRENVKVRIVTDSLPKNVSIGRSNKMPRIRFLNFKVPVEIAVYDNRRGHLAIFSNRDDIYRTDVAALTSNHPCFVEMLRSYFETLWEMAIEENSEKTRSKDESEA